MVDRTAQLILAIYAVSSILGLVLVIGPSGVNKTVDRISKIIGYTVIFICISLSLLSPIY